MKKYIILFVLFSHNVYSSGMSDRATVGSSRVSDLPAPTFSAAETICPCIPWWETSSISIGADKAHLTKRVVNQGTRTDAEVLEEEEKCFREEREDLRWRIWGRYYMDENSIPQDEIKVTPIYNDERKIVAVERSLLRIDPRAAERIEHKAGLLHNQKVVAVACCTSALISNVVNICFFLPL
jgi:hypothetical protein